MKDNDKIYDTIKTIKSNIDTKKSLEDYDQILKTRQHNQKVRNSIKGRRSSLQKKFRVSYLNKDTSLTLLRSSRSKSVLGLQKTESPERAAEKADKVENLAIEPKPIGTQEAH